MKKTAFFLLALTSFSVSANVSQKCIQEGQRAGDDHVERMLEKHGDALSAQDLAALEEDAAIIARVVARSCAKVGRAR